MSSPCRSCAAFAVGVGADLLQAGEVDVDGVGGGAVRGRWAGPGVGARNVAADSQGGGLVGVEDLGEGFHQQRQRVIGDGHFAGLGVTGGVVLQRRREAHVAAGDLVVVDGGAGGGVAIEPFLECADAVERGTVGAGGVSGFVGGIAQRDSAGEHVVEAVGGVHREPS